MTCKKCLTQHPPYNKRTCSLMKLNNFSFMPSEVITINNQGNELSYLFVSVSGPYNF